MNFGLAEVNFGSQGFLHVLKETNRFLAESGGVCEVWQGRRGNNTHCKHTESLEKHIKMALNFPWMCHEVPELPGSAWHSQQQATNTWSQRNSPGFQLERKAQHFVALLSYQNVYIN